MCSWTAKSPHGSLGPAALARLDIRSLSDLGLLCSASHLILQMTGAKTLLFEEDSMMVLMNFQAVADRAAAPG